VNNPVMMLDEIDKLGNDYRGDPARSVARDPRPGAEQHVSAITISTAVRPLERILHRDGEPARSDPDAAARSHGDHPARGLQRSREAEHAKQYLVPRQIKENGLTPEQLEITDDAINLLRARIHA
jgi:ATP-dependent Lon protease